LGETVALAAPHATRVAGKRYLAIPDAGMELAMSFSEFFSHAAHWTSRQCGRALTFGLAVAVVLVWAVTGPLFNFSDTWQLVINTGTTIVTFLMVFLIQNTQNRDTSAVQLKLDELIRVSGAARNRLLTLEDLTEAELDQVKASFARIAERGGVGQAAVEEVEEDLEEAKEASRANAKLSPSPKPRRKKTPADAA
jgi:low affinity Fe/Cu permease